MLAKSAAVVILSLVGLTAANGRGFTPPPKSAPPAEPISGPRNGTVETYTLQDCNKFIRLGKKHVWSMAPDTCLGTNSAASFRIREFAICANGTRARLARFEGRKCNRGKVTVEGGLQDILDRDIDRCQDLKPDGYTPDETHDSVASFAFYCDGRKNTGDDDDDDDKEEEKPKGPSRGSVSDSACPFANGRMYAPFFRHPHPDTCQRVEGGRRLKVFSTATCADGTNAKLARWSKAGCHGNYDKLEEMDESLLKTCLVMNDDEDSSFAFWCGGELQREDEDRVTPKPGDGGNGGGVWKLVLLLCFFVALGIFTCATACLRWADIVKKVMTVFRPQEGAIAL